MSLIDMERQHRRPYGTFRDREPPAHRDREFSRFEPVVRKINPRGPCARFPARTVTPQRNIVFGRIVDVVPTPPQ